MINFQAISWPCGWGWGWGYTEVLVTFLVTAMSFFYYALKNFKTKNRISLAFTYGALVFVSIKPADK